MVSLDEICVPDASIDDIVGLASSPLLGVTGVGSDEKSADDAGRVLFACEPLSIAAEVCGEATGFDGWTLMLEDSEGTVEAETVPIIDVCAERLEFGSPVTGPETEGVTLGDG